jgi:hypothetical protein
MKLTKEVLFSLIEEALGEKEFGEEEEEEVRIEPLGSAEEEREEYEAALAAEEEPLLDPEEAPEQEPGIELDTGSILAPEELAVWQGMLVQAAQAAGLNLPTPEELGAQDIGGLSEASKYKISQSILLPKHGDPAESGFCVHVPKISDWSRKSPENLAETIIFVFASMQTPWPKLVPFFRFIVDIVKDPGEGPASWLGQEWAPEHRQAEGDGWNNFIRYLKKPHRNVEQTDMSELKYYIFRHNLVNGMMVPRNDTIGDYSFAKADGALGTKDPKYISYNNWYNEYKKKRTAAKNKNAKPEAILAWKEIDKVVKQWRRLYKEDYISARQAYKIKEAPQQEFRRQTLYRVYMEANNIRSANELSDEQIEYLDAAMGMISYIGSTPSPRFYAQVWKDRESIAAKIFPLMDKVNEEGSQPSDLKRLYAQTLLIPGLAMPKAGFLVQLITGRLGCIDSIWSKVLRATDPDLAAQVKVTFKKKVSKKSTDTGDIEKGNVLKVAQAYIDLLKVFEDRYSMKSEDLWNAWVEQVNQQIKAPGKYKQGEVQYTLLRKKGDLYTPPSSVLTGPVGYSYDEGRAMQIYLKGGESSAMRVSGEHVGHEVGYPVEEGRLTLNKLLFLIEEGLDIYLTEAL